MKKTPITIRLEPLLLKEAKKLAAKNKKEVKLPKDLTGVIEQALSLYLVKNN